MVWLGFDDPASLGHGAFGGTLALPVWIRYMRGQLSDTPVQWVSANNTAKTQKAAQKVIDITDQNEAQVQKMLQKENSEADQLKADIIENTGNEVIAEGDGEAIVEDGE